MQIRTWDFRAISRRVYGKSRLRVSGARPGKDIHGVKFTIPSSLISGTNLSSDTGISVEEIASTSDCKATLFLDGVKEANPIVEYGTEYSMAVAVAPLQVTVMRK